MKGICERCGLTVIQHPAAPNLSTDAARAYAMQACDDAAKRPNHDLSSTDLVNAYMAGAREMQFVVQWYLRNLPAVPDHLRRVLLRDVAQLMKE